MIPLSAQVMLDALAQIALPATGADSRRAAADAAGALSEGSAWR